MRESVQESYSQQACGKYIYTDEQKGLAAIATELCFADVHDHLLQLLAPYQQHVEQIQPRMEKCEADHVKEQP